MNYFDTSYLVPLIVEETYSDQVTEYLATVDLLTLTTSHWTLVEFASMLSRGVRTRRFTHQEAARLQARFDSLVRGSFSLIVPTAEDYASAATFLASNSDGLRGPDAMHLAVAQNHAATAILSLDKKMIVSGRALGLPISTGTPIAGYP